MQPPDDNQRTRSSWVGDNQRRRSSRVIITHPSGRSSQVIISRRSSQVIISADAATGRVIISARSHWLYNQRTLPSGDNQRTRASTRASSVIISSARSYWVIISGHRSRMIISGCNSQVIISRGSNTPDDNQQGQQHRRRVLISGSRSPG